MNITGILCSSLKKTIIIYPRAVQAFQSRQSSFRSSPFVEDLGDVKVKYEVTRDPEEWKFVERVLPTMTVPEPIVKERYPSGWKPQGPHAGEHPYFVRRTKNHMIPVYMQTSQRGMKRLTYIRRIQGDIWLLERELKEFLMQDRVRPIRSQVNEFVGYICFNGDHVNAVKQWLLAKNF